MYDQSLEQLIDAVIADGVITDQERRVVYKKAAALGIDQDEIEVYLEGKLDTLRKNEKSNKHGVVRMCPNCGSPVEAGSAKCKECGFAFSGVEAVSSAKELAKLLIKAKNSNERIVVIRSFPIPLSREDLIEFLSSLEPKAFNRHNGDEDEQREGQAYYEKYQECLNKMKVGFPDDPALETFIQRYNNDKRSLHLTKKTKSRLIKIGAVLLVFLLSWACSEWDDYKENKKKSEYEEWYNENHSQIEAEVMAYENEMNEKIESLPEPNIKNYSECASKANQLKWEKSWSIPSKFKGIGWHTDLPTNFDRAQEEAFNKNLEMYKKRVGIEWKKANKQKGLYEYENIPSEYR